MVAGLLYYIFMETTFLCFLEVWLNCSSNKKIVFKCFNVLISKINYFNIFLNKKTIIYTISNRCLGVAAI